MKRMVGIFVTLAIAFAGTAILAGTLLGSGTIRLTNTTITDNITGLATAFGGSIISFVNNRIIGNGTNGSPTQSVFQK